MSRVAITTDRFAAVAPWFAATGLTPLHLPCIRVEPATPARLAEARHAAASADLVLITSARTVALLWGESRMPPVPVAAVGEATAAAVTDAGGAVEIVGHTGLADLAKRMAAETRPPRLVFPRAAGSDPRALAPLEMAGAEIVGFDVYRSVPVAPGPEPVDAVAFASPSAARGWLLSRDLEGIAVGVIGETTGGFVARHRPPDVVAPYPSHRALAESLASFLEVAV